jgi:hypothetical protein
MHNQRARYKYLQVKFETILDLLLCNAERNSEHHPNLLLFDTFEIPEFSVAIDSKKYHENMM